MRIVMSFPRAVFLAVSLAGAVIAAPPLAWSQAEPDAQQADRESDPIFEHVLPPEFIIMHADAIALTAEQRDQIIAQVTRLQEQAQTLTPHGEQARAHLLAALSAEPVEEARVLETLGPVLAFERDIKRALIATLVRIRNILTPGQRSRLDALR